MASAVRSGDSAGRDGARRRGCRCRRDRRRWRPGAGGRLRRSGGAAGGSASGTLTQLNASQWTTTVYLDTAALCAGSRPAGNHFSLVTGKPSSVTGAAAPAYPDGPLACAAAAVNPVTQVKLTFSPPLSAVPQTATLVVTPPQALLAAGDEPVQIPLTVRRTVSPWQFVGIPAICGGALAVLLVLLLMMIGVPGRRGGMPAAPEPPCLPRSRLRRCDPASPRHPGSPEGRGCRRRSPRAAGLTSTRCCCCS